MAAPSQINTLRAEDFASGIPDKATADKLFQILNPFLQSVGATTTAGTSLQTNIDGQFVSADIPKGQGWITMALTSPFTGNSFGTWPQPSYRVDGTGRLWLRGLFTSPSAPGNGTPKFWTYPDARLAPTSSGTTGTGRLFAVPFTSATATLAGLVRLDAGSDGMDWCDNQTVPFGWGGNGSWANLSMATNWGAGGTTPAYMRDANGRVYLRGLATMSAGTVTSGGTFATLPVGYRPSVTMDYPAIFDGVTNPLIGGEIQITTAGVCKIFFPAAAQRCNTLPLGGISFDAPTNISNPDDIYYGSLDAISWDCIGGCTVSTRAGLPLNIRLKDGKKPVAVLCWALNKDTNQVDTVAAPTWAALGAGAGGNQLQILSVPDLRDDHPYTLNFFVFF